MIEFRVAAFAISAGLAMAITPAALARDEPAPACPGLYTGGSVPFTGLFPAIEGRMALSNFRPGMIVEIDTTTMPEAEVREHIAELQALPARVSVYLPGGHCNLENKDCAGLKKAGVHFGPTGSWNWDKDERRIYDVAHPAVIARIVAAAERGWRLGANYVRVDNIHDPAGSKETRTADMLSAIFKALHALEDRLRADGVIPKDRPTGVVAHNNLQLWETLIKDGRLARPPVFLTSERTAQLAYKGEGYKGDGLMKAGSLKPADVEEIAAGRRIALELGIPYSIAEFQISHDLGGKPGTTYQLPAAYVTALAALPGVSEVFVVPSETHYIGPGKLHAGSGPKRLAAAPHPAEAGAIARACMSSK
jgi:hypothetical protein